MASKSHVEHDFFGMEKPNSKTHPSSVAHPRLDRRQSFRGISKISPEIVKSVMASAAKAENAPLPVAAPEFPRLPVFRPFPISRASNSENEKGKEGGDTETGPMTIFYNGTVAVFDLPKDKAEGVINFVMDKSSGMNENDKEVDEPSFNAQNDSILDSLNDGDLPIKRKKSLQRFFEKRKERLISASPYFTDHVSTAAATLHHKKTTFA